MPQDQKADDSRRMPPPPHETTGRSFNDQESTGQGRAGDRSSSRSSLPGRGITDTEGWKSSQKGLSRFWNNYKKTLRESFNRMTRAEQEDLIDKFAMIFTIGVTCLVVLIFYPVIPRLLRVIGVPVAFVAAWWASRRIVGPVVVDRLEHLLKKEERDADSTQKEER
jgi:hypothetical protein